jgi:hypothetical protein
MSAFTKILKRLHTENVTVYYLEGGRDKHFGSSYAAAVIELHPGSGTDDGLYYISHLDQLFMRETKNEEVITRRLSIEKECSLPQSLLPIIERVFVKKTEAVYVPDAASIRMNRATKEKKKKREEMIKLEVEDRYLVLRGGRGSRAETVHLAPADWNFSVNFTYR